ncbi:hypothetical protein CALVIDRAFT_35784 [Calocera viscosa TUFC12733]|uniref:Uncharacterized protein n=1 Tax=Calocera viscosa (strain TUFC12733) TaxID=1330018 RepID=A0A167FLZ8_CALVF|nr:hypothetical protein CALVIDRAFT_35784 [Calocera viscosa TUFC12733]
MGGGAGHVSSTETRGQATGTANRQETISHLPRTTPRKGEGELSGDSGCLAGPWCDKRSQTAKTAHNRGPSTRPVPNFAASTLARGSPFASSSSPSIPRTPLPSTTTSVFQLPPRHPPRASSSHPRAQVRGLPTSLPPHDTCPCPPRSSQLVLFTLADPPTWTLFSPLWPRFCFLSCSNAKRHPIPFIAITSGVCTARTSLLTTPRRPTWI